MKPLSIVNYWRKDPRGPVFIVCEDPFWQGFLEKEWITIYLSKRKALVHRIDLSQMEIEVLKDAVEEGDLFSDFRIIAVRGVEKLREEHIGFLKSAFNESGNFYDIIALSSSPLKGFQGGEKFYSIPSSLTPADIEEVIKYLVEKGGGNIDKDALSLLTDFVGNNLMFIEKDIEKLLSYHEDGHIDTGAIRELVAPLKEENIFNISGAIASGRTDEALKIVDNLLERVHPLQIIRFITSYYKRLAEIKFLLSERKDLDEIRKILSLKDYYLRKLLSEAQGVSEENLEKIFFILDEAELEVKKNQLPPGVVIKKIVMRLSEI